MLLHRGFVLLTFALLALLLLGEIIFLLGKWRTKAHLPNEVAEMNRAFSVEQEMTTAKIEPVIQGDEALVNKLLLTLIFQIPEKQGIPELKKLTRLGWINKRDYVLEVGKPYTVFYYTDGTNQPRPMTEAEKVKVRAMQMELDSDPLEERQNFLIGELEKIYSETQEPWKMMQQITMHPQ